MINARFSLVVGGLIGTLIIAIDQSDAVSVDVLASVVLKHIKKPIK